MESSNEKWDLVDFIKALPAILIAGIIIYYSSLSNPLPAKPTSDPPGILDINTILHICEYGLLSILVAFGFSDKTRAVYLIFSCILFAISDEIHQYFVPNRYFDIYDVLADSFGVILGFLFYHLVERIFNNHIY